MQAATVCPLYWCVHMCICKRIGSDTFWPLLALVWLCDVKTEAQLQSGRFELKRKVSETGKSCDVQMGNFRWISFGFYFTFYCASVACFGDFWLTSVLNLSAEDGWSSCRSGIWTHVCIVFLSLCLLLFSTLLFRQNAAGFCVCSVFKLRFQLK